MDVDLAVTLQIGHYFINIVVLSVLVYFSPDGYTVPGILGVGLLSLFPLAWQVRAAFRTSFMWAVGKLQNDGLESIVGVSYKRSDTE